MTISSSRKRPLLYSSTIKSDVVVRPAQSPVATSQDRLVVVHAEDDEAGLRADFRYSEYHAGSSEVEHVDGLADEGRMADALERVVHSSLGNPRSRTAATVSPAFEASMKSVAPIWRAAASFAGLASMTTIRPADDNRAAWTADSPIPPAPITTT